MCYFDVRNHEVCDISCQTKNLIKKFHRKGQYFWDTAYFRVILLVTGLVTDLKHRVMFMLWKICVGLTYSILIFTVKICWHLEIYGLCLVSCCFWRVIDVPMWIFAILSKNIPPKQILGHICWTPFRHHSSSVTVCRVPELEHTHTQIGSGLFSVLGPI